MIRSAPTVLELVPEAPSAVIAGHLVVVLDTTWTSSASADSSVIGCREVAERVLARMDLIEETSTRLDAWAERSGVIEATCVNGTSFWFYARLAHWLWLEERLIWLAIVDELVGSHRVTAIECAAGTDLSLVAAARAIAVRDGLRFTGVGSGAVAGSVAGGVAARTRSWSDSIWRRAIAAREPLGLTSR